MKSYNSRLGPISTYEQLSPFIIGVLVLFFLLVHLCCGTFVAKATAAKNGISLTIHAVDENINKDKPFKISIKIESNTEIIRIYRHALMGIHVAVGPNDWLQFVIIAPSGKVVTEYATRHPSPKRPFRGDFIDVIPDNSYSEVINVYPNAFRTELIWPESGTYKIKAIYSYKYNNWKYGQDLWEGTIESNWIYLEVNKKEKSGRL